MRMKNLEIVWNSRPGRVYAVYASENLSDWDELDDNVSSEERLLLSTKAYLIIEEGLL